MSFVSYKEKKNEIVSNRWKELQGKEVRDKVTGFAGVCTGQTRWLYGCD
ncbi:hypothetical protein LBYZC6_24570 [Lacrimispora brassicae]